MVYAYMFNQSPSGNTEISIAKEVLIIVVYGFVVSLFDVCLIVCEAAS